MFTSAEQLLPRHLEREHRQEVQLGVKAELEAASKALQFVVAGVRWVEAIPVVEVDREESRDGLKENLEESIAIWNEPGKAFGEVLSVDTERGCINLRYATGPLPPPGTRLFVTVPKYLESLQEVWYDNAWFDRILSWYNGALAKPHFQPGRGLSIGGSRSLRERQQMALQLPAWSTSYLWGPPGTGKTYTVGVLLARMLIERPASRVLLIASTNVAVDQALISVDDALKSERTDVRRAESSRRECARIGSNFRASLYKGRGHLLPAQNDDLLRELAQLEASRPEPDNVVEYAKWKNKVQSVRERLRSRFKDVAGRYRLMAMTATSATFQMDALREAKPFDFILFDEASQLSAAHALALAPLAPSAAFAGDPKQLAPITIAESRFADRWLGQSLFDRMEEGRANNVLLNEQSRMRQEICSLVSTVFYKGQLRVADDCRRDSNWHAARETATTPICGSSPAVWLRVASEGAFNFYYRGPCRKESAELIAGVVEEFIERGTDRDSIVVLTPYHAQRQMIRQALGRRQISGLTIATVHSIQGSERHTVIFDPVQGSSKFFMEEMGGRRLINVAISRAKARLVITLSAGDRQNPQLDQLVTLIDPYVERTSVPTVHHWMGRPDYPKCLVGQEVRVVGLCGMVTRASRLEDRISVMDAERAKELTFQLSILEAKTGGAAGARQPTVAPSANAMKSPRPTIVLRPTVVRVADGSTRR
ncbi:MAG TPA: DEAD/DEAH box helicase [Phycisphaerales bacterium]|nr:DEAD/DEAH box helicase [Phycisphaerales bacterium]